MKKQFWIAIGITVVLLSGCTKTPLQKLQGDRVYSELNNPFWVKEQEAKTTLWQDAVHYCQTHTGKINCGTVMQLFVITNGSTNVPAYGSSGNFLTVPNF